MNFWVRTCPSPYTLFNQVDFLCYNLCPAGTYLVSADSLCVACHYSCATCTTGTSCVTCPTNKVLDRDVGVTACGDICGDGSVRTDPCDDGNTIDNDGCSSSCQKEQYFSCDNPIPPAVTPASNCYFTGDITVNVVRI